jgi:hypothetical protein
VSTDLYVCTCPYISVWSKFPGDYCCHRSSDDVYLSLVFFSAFSPVHQWHMGSNGIIRCRSPPLFRVKLPTLYVCRVEDIFGRVPVFPCILDGNSTVPVPVWNPAGAAMFTSMGSRHVCGTLIGPASGVKAPAGPGQGGIGAGSRWPAGLQSATAVLGQRRGRGPLGPGDLQLSRLLLLLFSVCFLRLNFLVRVIPDVKLLHFSQYRRQP